MDKAGLTGTFEGMPTQAALQFGAENFGTWGAPQQGAETLASKQQTVPTGNSIRRDSSGSTCGAGGPQQGQQTLAGAEQGFTQGLRTQQEQRAAQAQQQAQAQQYLQLLILACAVPLTGSSTSRCWAATPGGMRDLVGAAMGQYVPGGGATTGYQPQAVSLQSLQGDVTGQAYQGQGGGQLNMPNVYGQNSAGMYQQQPQYSNQYQYPQVGAQQTQQMLQGQMNPQLYAQQATQPQQPQEQPGRQRHGQRHQHDGRAAAEPVRAGDADAAAGAEPDRAADLEQPGAEPEGDADGPVRGAGLAQA